MKLIIQEREEAEAIARQNAKAQGRGKDKRKTKRDKDANLSSISVSRPVGARESVYGDKDEREQLVAIMRAEARHAHFIDNSGNGGASMHDSD